VKYYGLVKRKIRSGRVRINKKVFVPQQNYLEYDGRLDGMWYWFGVYPKHTPLGVEMGDKVSLWGTDEMYHHQTDTYGPECVDNTFPWQWWEVV
jgi:hypothetical protein